MKKLLNTIVVFVFFTSFFAAAQKSDLYCPFDVVYNRGFNQFTAYFTIFNNGINSEATTIDFYLSNDFINDAADLFIGSYQLAAISAGDLIIDSFQFNICPYAFDLNNVEQSGLCNLWFQIDPQNLVNESKEDNNLKFDSLSLNYDCSLGIHDLAVESSITVFPNPSDGNFEINLPPLDNESVDIDLLSLEGKKIETLTHQIAGQNFSKVFQLSYLEPGIYFLQLKSNAATSVKRIVIEK